MAESNPQTAEDFTAALLDLIAAGDEEHDDDFLSENPLATLPTTFAEAGVLTNNHGLVVRLADGTEFQVTVVQSRA